MSAMQDPGICGYQNIDISAIFVSPIFAQSVSDLSRTSDFSSNPYAYGSDTSASLPTKVLF